jgi:hypothetical protein
MSLPDAHRPPARAEAAPTPSAPAVPAPPARWFRWLRRAAAAAAGTDEQGRSAEEVDALIARAPKDLLGTTAERVERLLQLIQGIEKKRQFPQTIGIFGTWGSGKTFTLAHLAAALRGASFPVIYFSAYRYAGHMEVVPALIYKLIYGTPLDCAEAAKRRLLSVVTTLGGKYAGRMGEWAEGKVGLNPVSLLRDARDALDVFRASARERQQLLKQYYTRLDDVQETLAKVFAGQRRATVVLLDELDRCDPGEAFEIMKQLRTLFSLTGVPVVFVLAANPEPIGLAIKHRYGLGSAGNDYEARRILEKFVDVYEDQSQVVSLRRYVEGLWERDPPLPARLDRASLVHRLDARTARPPGRRFADDSIRNATALEAMASNHPMYGNLRLMEKTLGALHATRARVLPDGTAVGGGTRHPWTLWLLSILKQSDPAARAAVGRLTQDFKVITERATLAVLRAVADGRGIEGGGFARELSFGDSELQTPYAVFYRAFWNETHARVDHLARSGERATGDLLSGLRASVPMMDFLAQMCLIQVESRDPAGPWVAHSHAGELGNAIHDLAPNTLSDFGWHLANY